MTVYDIFPDIIRNPIFLNASPGIVNQYLDRTTFYTVNLSSGDLIYSSESKGIHVGIILQGSAKVHTGICGMTDPTLLKTLSVGDTFGIANLYAEQEPFPSRILAAERCKVLFIDGTAFKQFIEHDPVALRNYLTMQSQKIVYLNRKIMTYTAGCAEKKLAVFLLDHAVDSIVTLPCSMSELASLLGMGRASLYRALETLTQYGWIQKQEKSIQIVDKSAMEQAILGI